MSTTGDNTAAKNDEGTQHLNVTELDDADSVMQFNNEEEEDQSLG